MEYWQRGHAAVPVTVQRGSSPRYSTKFYMITMIRLKNESKSTRCFEQHFGKDCFIYVSSPDDEIWYIKLHSGNDHINLCSDDVVYDKLREIRFKGNYVSVKYVCSDLWENDKTVDARLFFKDRRVVAFLRDNIKEIFRQGSDDYEVTALKDGCTFRFGPKNRRHFTVFGVMDPVCGNLLSDSIKEADSWMKPGCRSVKFSVYYEGSLKDITPVCSHDGFNYYDVICDSEFLEDDRSGYRWFEIKATMGGIEPRDSRGPRTRFLLKMRKERPDVIYPYLFYVPGNELEQIQGTVKDGKNCLYFIETGETIAYDDYRDLHHREVCSLAISEMAKELENSLDGSVSREIEDDFTIHGRVSFRVSLERTVESDGKAVITLKAFGAERTITCDDAAGGCRAAGEWLVEQEDLDMLKRKWNMLAEKYNSEE